MCENSECVIEYIKGVKDVNSLEKYPNPLYKELKCGLLNSKKKKYYTNKCIPSPSLHKLPDLTGIDLTTRSDCCMCVSVSLYYTGNIDIKLQMFLASIIRTVGNVKKYLPNWLVRIYIDPSVFKGLIKYQKQKNLSLYLGVSIFPDVTGRENDTHPYPYILEYLECLFAAENVEMYTYFCDSKESIEARRTYRFLPMLDPSVSAYAIREADGIVTVMDCYNLDYMVTNKLPMYIVPWGVATGIPCMISYSYQKWLNIYKKGHEYYKTKCNVVDLLAGTFSGTIKILPNHYYSCMEEVIEFLDYIYSDQKLDLYFSLDEMLLMRLYRDVICVEKKSETRDKIDTVNNRLEIIMKGVANPNNNYEEYTYIDKINIVHDHYIWNQIKDSPDLLEKWKLNEGKLIPLHLLRCTVEQFRDLMVWFDTVTEKIENMRDSSTSPSAVDYLMYEMLERLIVKTPHVMTLIFIDNSWARTKISSPSLVNVSHINPWCRGDIFNKVCLQVGLKLMDAIRARTKMITRN